jgi:PPK2 family polyphosphate:nucleotide phosphotransferase
VHVFEAPKSPYLVPFDGSFRMGAAPTAPPDGAPKKSKLQGALQASVRKLDALQQELYADDRWGVLLVFQAMDAAGKDSTIRAVLRGINPQGCQVFSFKQPSSEELDHDFLWRVAKRLPERGCIGVFNRSHYEEVLVVRVNPGYLAAQKLPRGIPPEELWAERFESIVHFERHVARSGFVILKFFLNVSGDEQAERFRRRLDRPDKNWKFSEGDLDVRKQWGDYMEAYEAALNATSRPWAPWFAVPADDKPYMRATVAGIVQKSLESLDLSYPKVDKEGRKRLQALRERID